MDERGGEIVALPCCLHWIKTFYGYVGAATLEQLWNSEEAQRTRYLIATGHQEEVCSALCPYWMSKQFSEAAIRVLNGSPIFLENQALNNKEIRLRRTALQSKPMLLKVIPTLECNIRCTMCFQGSYRQLDLGVGFWQEIEWALPYTREVTFQGGEVTLMPTFRDFVRTNSDRFSSGVRMSLITNGTVLDDELFDLFAGIVINYVAVSLNASTRETYLKITKADLFDQVIDNVKRLRRISATHASRSFDILLSLVVTQSNFRELPSFLRLAAELGVEAQLLPMVGNRGGENILSCREMHGEYSQVLKKTAAMAPRRVVPQIRHLELLLKECEKGYGN